jgi:hypothetical protein
LSGVYFFFEETKLFGELFMERPQFRYRIAFAEGSRQFFGDQELGWFVVVHDCEVSFQAGLSFFVHENGFCVWSPDRPHTVSSMKTV